MEYAKDEIFSIHYNEKKDKLEKSFFRKFLKKILCNKFMSLLIGVGLIFSVLNFTLIYMFFEILNRTIVG